MLFKKDHRLVECLCIVEAKKFGQLKPFFSQQKIENRIAKNASNRPLRPFFLSIGFKLLLLLSFGLLSTIFDYTFFSLLWFTVYQPPETSDKILFFGLTKCRPSLSYCMPSFAKMVWMKSYCDGTIAQTLTLCKNCFARLVCTYFWNL